VGRLSATLAAVVEGASVAPVILVRMAFPAGTLYLSDGPYPVSYGGNTYTNDGTLQAISSVHERTDSKVGSITVSLAATSTVRTAIAGAIQYAEVGIAWGFLSSGSLLDAESLGTFFMSTAEYDITGGSVGVICEPVAIRLLRANTVMASKADQNKRYSGDTGFDFTAAMDELELEWGGQRARYLAGAPATGQREGLPPRYRED
jgi:hypothetical protein